MKQIPATSKPGQPARTRPMWIAISVEFGPGMRLVAPRKSRNCSRVSQPRRATASSSIIAMCAGGPPKAIVPSFRKSRVSSSKDVRGAEGLRCESCMVSKPSCNANPHQLGDARIVIKSSVRRSDQTEAGPTAIGKLSSGSAVNPKPAPWDRKRRYIPRSRVEAVSSAQRGSMSNCS